MTCQSIFFNLINIMVAGLVIAAGVLRCIGALGEDNVNAFPDFVVGVYEVLFGFIIVVVEIAVPLMIAMYAGFLHTFFGKSVAYIFLGVLVMGPPDTNAVDLFRFIAGLVILLVALIFFVFQFIPAIERPRPLYYSPKPEEEA